MNKQPNTLTELLAHALMLAQKGESFSGKFEYTNNSGASWHRYAYHFTPQFGDVSVGWRIVDEDQHLLDDGWIRHTGDVCPVHELDEIKVLNADRKAWGESKARGFEWSASWKVTYYKVTKKYDPHAENKALYAEDALVLKEPWKLWAYARPHADWQQCFSPPEWLKQHEYRREQTKKQLIKWEHEYFKGCATNFGEFLAVVVKAYGTTRFIVEVSRSGGTHPGNLRLATPADDHANWQPFFSTPENDAKLQELAKMVKVEVRWFSRISQTFAIDEVNPSLPFGENAKGISNYRITGLQEGWTDNKEDV